MPQIRVLRGVSNDLHYALRSMRRNLPFTLIFVITLSVGIGINTAAFSMINAWVWHPVSLPAPQELVVLSRLDTRTGSTSNVPPGVFLDWKSSVDIFQTLDAWERRRFSVSNGEVSEQLSGARVTATFFVGSGVRPSIGRLFEAGDEHTGPNVVVVSHDFWKTWLHADTTLSSHPLKLDGERYQVAGVLPPDFDLPLMGRVDMWTVLRLTPAESINRTTPSLGVLGRLKPGLTVAAAERALVPMTSRLAREHPDTDNHAAVRIRSLAHVIADNSGKKGLVLLYGVVACILVMACVNVSNMSLARVISERGQLAVRLAIGAGRWRLVRQALVQNLVLSLVAAIAAAGIAKAILIWTISQLPHETKSFLPHSGLVSSDCATLLYAIGVATGTSILFGLTPAMQASRTELSETLRDSNTRASAGAHGNRLRRLLVGCQFGLAVVVLVVAGLMTRSIIAVLHVDTGFESAGVVTAEIQLPAQSYSDDASVRAFTDQILNTLRKVDDISVASVASAVPFGSTGAVQQRFSVDDVPAMKPDETPAAAYVAVSPGFLPALSVRRIAGRMIDDQDRPSAQPVAVINETLAKKYLPSVNPIGHQIRLLGRSETPLAIVGVVADVKFSDPGEPAVPEIFVSFAQFPSLSVCLLARTTGAGLSLFAATIQKTITAINHDESVGSVRSLQGAIDDHEAGNRVFVILINAFGLLALTLAALGIYSVMLYSVAARSLEIGIRMAVGANRWEVGWMVMKEGCRLALIGGGIGLLLALGLARLLAGILYGVSPHDMVSLLAASAGVAVVTLLACAGPSMRASRTDPLTAIRCI
jgi:putative ABC transport system permease protein